MLIRIVKFPGNAKLSQGDILLVMQNRGEGGGLGSSYRHNIMLPEVTVELGQVS